MSVKFDKDDTSLEISALHEVNGMGVINRKAPEEEQNKKMSLHYQKNVMAGRVLILCMLATIVFVVLLMMFFSNPQKKYIYLICVVGCVVGWVVADLVGKGNKSIYGQIFMEYKGEEMEEIASGYFGPMLDNAGEADVTSRNNHLFQRMKNSKLYSGWENWSVDNYRKGIRNGVKFEAYKTILSCDKKTGKSENDAVQTCTVFRGIWLNCEMNKELSSDMQIKKKTEDCNGTQLRETGIAEFDESYVVLGENASMNQQVLTSELIGMILQLKESVGNICEYSFQGNTMSVALDTEINFNALTIMEDATKTIAEYERSLQFLVGVLDKLAENKWLFE